MSCCGLLILSNLKKIQNSLELIKRHVKNLYIHVNIQKSTAINPPALSRIITKIYQESLRSCTDLDIRVLVTPLKTPTNEHEKSNKKLHIDYIFLDLKLPEICEKEFKEKYSISKPTIYLNDDNHSSSSSSNDKNVQEIQDQNDDNLDIPETMLNSTANDDQQQLLMMHDTVVLGGTFDRIHVGHKILLTEAVLRARQRLVVGVTDENMITSKILHELILPVEERIKDVREFLLDIDSSLQYDVVPIQDPFGPTKSDPNMNMIIVSAETLRGGHKVNEVRIANGLNPLKIHCISMIEEDDNGKHCQYKETKISSSNKRMDLLGTRINPRQPRPNLPEHPYIIGLAGGIASGKSKMAERLQNFGAHVIDCDKIAHEIYEPGKECYRKIIDFFGSDIKAENDEKIDRKKLGSIVFGNPKLLEKLNEIVWPELLVEAKKRIYESYEKNKFDVVILEAAVLLKAGWDRECHEVWSMIVTPQQAIKRLKERNNMSGEEAQKRLEAQVSNKEIVKRSNVVFSSEWSDTFTQEQAERAWKMLKNEIHSSS